MTPFFSLKLSQALQEAGCVSDNPFVYFADQAKEPSYYTPHEEPKILLGINAWGTVIRAFGWWDLCGPSETLLSNAKIIWPGHQFFTIKSIKCVHCGAHVDDDKKCFEIHRHALIDLPSHEEQEKYIMSTMRRTA